MRNKFKTFEPACMCCPQNETMNSDKETDNSFWSLRKSLKRTFEPPLLESLGKEEKKEKKERFDEASGKRDRAGTETNLDEDQGVEKEKNTSSFTTNVMRRRATMNIAALAGEKQVLNLSSQNVTATTNTESSEIASH